MRRQKAQVPIYPRPVSPLHAEPIPILPGDEVSGCNDDEEDIDKRSAKRRRIEQWGQRYLRGEGIFILSAGLKGPFDGKEWENPWKGEIKMGNMVGSALEVPETARRRTGRDPNSPATKKMPAQNTTDPFAPKASDHTPGRQGLLGSNSITLPDKLPSKDRQVEDWLKTNNAYRQNVEHVKASSPTPISAVKDQSNHARSSPGISRGAAGQHHAKQVLNIETLPTECGGSNSNSLPHAASLSAESAENGTLNTARKKAVLGASDSGVARKALQARDEDFQFLAENSGRAQHTIIKVKRKPLHTIPPSTNLPAFEYRRVSGHNESCSDVRRFQRVDRKRVPETSQHISCAPQVPIVKRDLNKSRECHSDKALLSTEHTGAEMPAYPCSVGKSMKSQLQSSSVRPILSVETSITSTTNLLPSAQFIPAQPPLFSVINQSTGDKMLDEPPNVETAMSSLSKCLADAVKQATSTQCTLVRGQIPLQHAPPPARSEENTSASTPRQPQPASPRPIYQANDLNTQQMLASMTPLGFSTVKKIPLKATPIQKSSPTTATKRKMPSGDKLKPKKAAKRASFVRDVVSISSGSSQGSIKTSMKVSKGAAAPNSEIQVKRPGKGGEPSPFGKLGLDMETSDDDKEDRAEQGEASKQNTSTSDRLPGPSSLLGNEPKPPRLALKSALKSSAPALTSSTAQMLNPSTLVQSSASRNGPSSTGSGYKQDAQLHAHRAPIALSTSIDKPQNNMCSIHPHGNAKYEDVGFDLKGAIDDLGSYLGTWDADKEASGLVATE